MFYVPGRRQSSTPTLMALPSVDASPWLRPITDRLPLPSTGSMSIENAVADDRRILATAPLQQLEVRFVAPNHDVAPLSDHEEFVILNSYMLASQHQYWSRTRPILTSI